MDLSNPTPSAPMENEGCPVEMSDGKPCGRPIYVAPKECDEQPNCLMHSHDPDKPQDEFNVEIKAILAGTSPWHHPNDLLDFTHFVFFCCDFSLVTFSKSADFSDAAFAEGAQFNQTKFRVCPNFHFARFTGHADFRGAVFTEGARFSGTKFLGRAEFEWAHFAERAHFAFFTTFQPFDWVTFGGDADFHNATFAEGVRFMGATFAGARFTSVTFTESARFMGVTFTKGVNFHAARFSGAVEFTDVTFASEDPLESAIVDFRDVSFRKPELVRFLRINEYATQGLRARFMNCPIECIQFGAVCWYRHENRMVLQDELDLLEPATSKRGGSRYIIFEHASVVGPPEKLDDPSSYEEVAIIYRLLIINFEKTHAYDLVEDCTIGEFEMKRRDPDRFLFAERLKPVYEGFKSVRTMGEWASVAGIYRWASLYGTSYQRAVSVLGLLLLAFGFCFSTIIDIRPVPTLDGIVTCDQSSAVETVCSGVLHAVEVATLQRTWL